MSLSPENIKQNQREKLSLSSDLGHRRHISTYGTNGKEVWGEAIASALSVVSQRFWNGAPGSEVLLSVNIQETLVGHESSWCGRASPVREFKWRRGSKRIELSTGNQTVQMVVSFFHPTESLMYKMHSKTEPLGRCFLENILREAK